MKKHTINSLEKIANSNNWILNPNKDILNKIIKGLNKKNGYCPCRILKSEENKCPCIFVNDDIKKSGHCFCNLFFKK